MEFILTTKEVLTNLIQEAVNGIKGIPTTEQKQDDEFITLHRAASMLGCHKNTIRNRIASGNLKAYKSERTVRVRKIDVIRLMEND